MKITTSQFNELKQQTDVAAILKAVGVEVEEEAWPRATSICFCMGDDGRPCSILSYDDDEIDRFRLSLNNVHRTREDAEHYKATTIRRWQAECAIRNWRDKHCPFKADWADSEQKKWHNYFDYMRQQWDPSHYYVTHIPGLPLFATESDAKACLDALPSEWEVLRETGG